MVDHADLPRRWPRSLAHVDARTLRAWLREKTSAPAEVQRLLDDYVLQTAIRALPRDRPERIT